MVKVRRNFELVDDADHQDYGKTIPPNSSQFFFFFS